MKNWQKVLAISLLALVICIAIGSIVLTNLYVQKVNIKSIVKKKYEVTLPMNSTKGLECAVYDSNTGNLYLKYEYGICVIDNEDNIERYVNGDLEYAKAYKLIQNTINNINDKATYMTSEEFNKIIE